MFSKKLGSLGLTIAITSSISLLTGCPVINVVPESGTSSTPTPATTTMPSSSINDTIYGNPSSSSLPSGSVTSSPNSSSSPSSSVVPSVSPTPENTTTSDTKDNATFNGTVYDTSGVPVEGANVNAVSIDSAISWKGDTQITSGGSYVFRNAPVGVRLQITASKDGWTSRTRTEVLKSNLTGDPNANKFDFEGRDAIQDEPEVSQLKINDKLITGAGKILTGIGESQRPLSTTPPNISALNPSNLKFDFTFSEPVDTEDFENGFIVYSQEFQRDGAVNGTVKTDIDSGLNDISFDWNSSRTNVVVETNKPVLAQKTADEARYNLFLNSDAVKDDSGKSALAYTSSNNQGVFRFSSKTTSDNVVFSVNNDTVAPALSSISAKSGGGSNDTVELRFTEPLDVVGFTSPLASLNYNGSGFEDFSTFFYTYVNTIVGDTSKTVFTFSQLLSSTDSSIYFPVTLDNSIRSSQTPVTTSSPTIKKVKLEGNKLSIEFAPNSLITGLKLLVSVGKTPTITTPSLPTSSVEYTPSYIKLTDTAGNEIAEGSTSTSSGITVSGIQKWTTIN